jgi:hypothetical protein
MEPISFIFSFFNRGDSPDSGPAAFGLLALIIWAPLSLLSTSFKLLQSWNLIKLYNLFFWSFTSYLLMAFLEFVPLKYNNEYEWHRGQFIWVNLYVFKVFLEFITPRAVPLNWYVARLIDIGIIIALYQYIFWWLWPAYIRAHGYDDVFCFLYPKDSSCVFFRMEQFCKLDKIERPDDIAWFCNGTYE